MMLAPRAILITGSSRGIGAATAIKAAAAGYSVYVNYLRSEAQATRLVEGIIASGGTATAIQADVSIKRTSSDSSLLSMRRPGRSPRLSTTSESLSTTSDWKISVSSGSAE
jgi:NAD(P)-dependent dehydrogenase (short-subunit alcohol dehydrogenase family)